MKNLILVAAIMLFGTVGFAQIKVMAPDGDVKVGNTSVAPTEKLDVDGNAVVRGANMFLGADSGFQFTRTATGSSRFVHSGTGQYQFSSLDAGTISFRTNDITRMQVRANSGNLVLLTGSASKPGGGTWSVLSDKRLKTDIKEYKDGLEQLLNINPVTFRYTKELLEDNEKEFVGVLAQEVSEVAPYMTAKTEIYDSNGEVKSNDYLSVDPNAFTYMLINAVQEQQDIIADQSNEIDDLKKDMQELKEYVKGLASNNNSVETYDISFSAESKLEQNIPNPFSENTLFNFDVAENASNAQISIVSMDGKILNTIAVKNGAGQVNFNAENLAAGTYFYRLVVDGELVESKKMIIAK